MEFDPQDQEVIRELRKLKQTDKEYPPQLLAARRQRFVRRMGEISLGVGNGASLQHSIKGAKYLPTSPIASRLLETVLVVAIIAEAGAVTYFYRDRLADLLQTFVASGEVQEIISPPVITTALTTTLATPIPEHTFTPELESTRTPEVLTASAAPADWRLLPHRPRVPVSWMTRVLSIQQLRRPAIRRPIQMEITVIITGRPQGPRERKRITGTMISIQGTRRNLQRTIHLPKRIRSLQKRSDGHKQ